MQRPAKPSTPVQFRLPPPFLRPDGEIGRHEGLKILCLSACRFESGSGQPDVKAKVAMAVNLKPPASLLPVAGIRLGTARAIKSKRRDDLTAVEIAPGASVAGVFTRNLYPAPPVTVCREHLTAGGNIRGMLINAGIANAGTLGRGKRDALQSCRLFAKVLGCRAEHVLPFSTGVIMEYLPMKQYAAGLQQCIAQLKDDNWLSAARAIMTTDTVAKGTSRTVRDGKQRCTVTGIAKGSGMIHPNMGTMLAFVATDAAIPPARLSKWQREITARTFNSISVDGDTSTNDSFMLIATGQAGKSSAGMTAKIRGAIEEVSAELAEAIIRDGEGATKLVIIRARGASESVCRKTAAAVAVSPLVKTALAAGDANVGRFLMAIGNSGGGFDPKKLKMQIGGAPVILGGGLHPKYNEAKVAKVMARDEIVVDIVLGDSKHAVAYKTCDLTHKYIQINADYRS